MSMLIENLKLYIPFQKQPIVYKLLLFLLLFFFILIFVAIRIINILPEFIEINNFRFLIFIIFSYFLALSGVLVQMLQMDILSKPFSFCLPGHHKVLRKTVFTFALIFGLIFTVSIFLLPLGESPKHYMLIMVPGMVLSFYLLSICDAFYSLSKKQSNFICIGFILICFFLLGSFVSSIFVELTFNDIFWLWSIPLFISGVFLLMAVWKILGDPDLKRKAFEKHSKSMTDPSTNPFDMEYLNKTFSSRRWHKDTEKDSNESEFFLKTMKKQLFFGMKHSLTGLIYLAVSQYCSLKKHVFGVYLLIKFILWTSILFVTGYLVSDEGHVYDIIVTPVTVFALMLSSGMIIEVFISPAHKLLLPEGRARQFRARLILWLIRSLLLVCWASMVIAASLFIQYYIPEIEIAGYNFSYTNYLPAIVFFPLMITPIIELISCTKKTPRIFIISILLCAIQIILLSLFFTSLAKNIEVQIVIISLMLPFTSGFYLLLMHRYWFRLDHV